MSLTKVQILTRVAANANGEATAPTVGGDEYNQWGEFLETAQSEWYLSYDPQVLIKTFNTTMAQSGTSVALPADFKEKFAGWPLINGNKVDEINPVQELLYSGSLKALWGGNQADGYYMKLTKALTSGASLMIPYHSRATSLATSTSVSAIPDPEFLVNRVTEKVLLQRGQPEYQEFQAQANLLLQRMAGNEVSSELQRMKTIKTSAEYNGFVIGRD
jgi:hypothetical protein